MDMIPIYRIMKRWWGLHAQIHPGGGISKSDSPLDFPLVDVHRPSVAYVLAGLLRLGFYPVCCSVKEENHIVNTI